MYAFDDVFNPICLGTGVILPVSLIQLFLCLSFDQFTKVTKFTDLYHFQIKIKRLMNISRFQAAH